MCINLGQQDLRICDEGCFYRHGIVGPLVYDKTVSSLLYCGRGSILRVVEPSFDSALLSRFHQSLVYEHFKLQSPLGLAHIRTLFNRTYRRIFVSSSLTWSFRIILPSGPHLNIRQFTRKDTARTNLPSFRDLLIVTFPPRPFPPATL
jgi:hypothetical protein